MMRMTFDGRTGQLLSDQTSTTDIAPGLSGSDGKVNSLAWYPWYPGRWFGSNSVKCMTITQKGAYRELLDCQWQGKGYLPADISALSLLAGTDMKAPEMAPVLAMFPESRDGLRANPTLLSTWNHQHNRYASLSASRKKREIEREIEREREVRSTASTLLPHQKQDASRREGWSLEDCMKASAPIGMPSSMVEAFFANYASVGWVDAAGRKVVNLSAALAKWKANQPSHGKGKPPEHGQPPRFPEELNDYTRQMNDMLEMVKQKKLHHNDIDRLLRKVRDSLGVASEAELRRRFSL